MRGRAGEPRLVLRLQDHGGLRGTCLYFSHLSGSCNNFCSQVAGVTVVVTYLAEWRPPHVRHAFKATPGRTSPASSLSGKKGSGDQEGPSAQEALRGALAPRILCFCSLPLCRLGEKKSFSFHTKLARVSRNTARRAVCLECVTSLQPTRKWPEDDSAKHPRRRPAVHSEDRVRILTGTQRAGSESQMVTVLSWGSELAPAALPTQALLQTRKAQPTPAGTFSSGRPRATCAQHMTD